ncbi:MAG: phosphotransferase [Asticcacaulis sp.]|uniref:phosphotransferase n=1 Tax=Asticcacaulis sp. TaxID=1872648 RepID=UPI0039E62A85
MSIMVSSLSADDMPEVTETDAETLAWQLYGLRAKASPLTGERDRNFRMRSDKGEYVLKVSNTREAPATTHFQNAMLRHLHSHGTDVPLPRLISTLTGQDEAIYISPVGSTHIVRLISYLPGKQLSAVSQSADLRRQVAVAAGKIDLALSDFVSGYSDNEMLWNIARADRIRPLLANVENRDLRRLADDALAHWEASIHPALMNLPHQFIHNDLNLHNIVVDEAGTLSGIIDFGDAVKAPAICELATAAAYQLFDLDDPVSALAAMASEYHAVRPISEAEIDVLVSLVATRWAITIGIAHTRARRHQTNGAYIMRNAPPSHRALEKFATISVDAATDILKQTCFGRGTK